MLATAVVTQHSAKAVLQNNHLHFFFIHVFPGGSYRPGPPGQPGPPGPPGRDGVGSESFDVGHYIEEYLQSKMTLSELGCFQ